MTHARISTRALPGRRLAARRAAVGLAVLMLAAPLAGCRSSRPPLVDAHEARADSLAAVAAALHAERDSLRAALDAARVRADTLADAVALAREQLRQQHEARAAAAFAARADSLRHQYVLDFLRGQEQARQLRGRTAEVIYFDRGTTLTPEAAERLGRLAARLRRLPPSARILVEGHTDDTPFADGSQRNNRTLSAGRAAVVRQYLVEQSGLPPERFEAAGFGADMPLFANEDPAARRFNRRVRIAILEP